MSWFTVDDKFYSHPKVLGIGLPAVGVWTLAGSWCSAHLTDGYIPADALRLVCSVLTPADQRALGRATHELVERSLWTPSGDGWQFVDWGQWQKSREQVLAARAATRARQEAYRERKRHEV